MANLISTGSPVNGKRGFLKSHSPSPSNSGRYPYMPTVQETDSKTTHKAQLRETQFSRRESSMILKNIFFRGRCDDTDNHSLPPISENIHNSSKRKEATVGSITNFAKNMSLKGSFTQKDVNENICSKSSLDGRSVKKNISAHRISRSTSFTSSTKPLSLKVTRQTDCSSSSSSSLSSEWETPPLYQAYPQAIKYSRLSASTLSADFIIQVDSNRRSNSVRESLAKFDNIIRQNQSHNNFSSYENNDIKLLQSHYRTKSSKYVTSAEWTHKIFVLVTSGYLLQYSGSGRFDRMPEKILQLGKDSVAFASDAIPGKHWVLQVSQSMSSDGSSMASSRSILSRLNLKCLDHRKVAKSLLLVFDNADDLESWIYVLRREIKLLGGGVNRLLSCDSSSETAKYYERKPLPLPKQSCQRFLLHDAETCSLL